MNEEIIEQNGKKYKVIEIMEEPTKDKVIVNGWDRDIDIKVKSENFLINFIINLFLSSSSINFSCI